MIPSGEQRASTRSRSGTSATWLLRSLSATPMPVSALQTLKTFFRWCVGRAVIDFSPAEGVQSNWRDVSRDRVLTDQELAAVVLGARQMPWPYRGIVEFLALTGQRREEVAQLKWHEIDGQGRTWCMSAERTKNNKAHIIHVSEPAWAVICGRLGEPDAYVFGTSRGKHFQAFAKGKRASTGSPGSAAGDYTICAEQWFLVWRDWASHLTWQTRSSITSRERFLGWRLSINATNSWPSARRP